MTREEGEMWAMLGRILKQMLTISKRSTGPENSFVHCSQESKLVVVCQLLAEIGVSRERIEEFFDGSLAEHIGKASEAGISWFFHVRPWIRGFTPRLGIATPEAESNREWRQVRGIPETV